MIVYKVSKPVFVSFTNKPPRGTEYVTKEHAVDPYVSHTGHKICFLNNNDFRNSTGIKT